MPCRLTGRTTDFESVYPGSNPGEATKFQLPDHLTGRIALSESVRLGSNPSPAAKLGEQMLLIALRYVGVLFAGGLITSFAEYKKNYNLYDLLKDKLFGK